MTTQRGRGLAGLALVLAVGARGGDARADDEVQIEIPVLIVDYGEETPDEDPELDPSLLVKSAAKRLETVMETSSIVTVVTREEILARGYRQIEDVLADVPGFEGGHYLWYSGQRTPMARGQSRTILLLWNGVPANDPSINIGAVEMDIPLDSVQRLEIVSGPGGVLWGANAYLGVVNVVTRRAGDELDRASVTVLAGGGPGRQSTVGLRASASDTYFDDRLGVFLDVSVTSTRDAALDMPYDVLFTPFPGSVDGTARLNESSGPLSTDRELCAPVTLAVDYADFKLDMLANLVCQFRDEVDPRGIRTDHFVEATGEVVDGGSSLRRSEWTVLTLQWSRALAEDARLAARAYYAGFTFTSTEQMFHPPGQLGPEAVVADTESIGANPLLKDSTYRGGTTVDATASLSRHSLLAGVEAYVEGQREWVTEGAGTETLTVVEDSVLAPAARRLVLAAFASDKVRLPRGLVLELAARAQGAGGDEAVAYDPLYLLSGAFAWRIARDRYLKLNYAEGFRPPPMAAIAADDSTVGALVGGNTDLLPERSRAAEVELSAIVLRDRRTVRRVHLRGGYQFSDLDDLVLGRSGTLRNAGRRLVHTVEARADVRFRRGHRLLVAGHYLLGEDSEIGPVRNAANLKLHLSGDWALSERLRATAGVTMLGAREDLNRLPVRSDILDVDYIAPSGSVVIDRAPPFGALRVGLRAVDLWGRFDVAAFAENAFDATPPVPDVDFDKRDAFLPQTVPGTSAYVTVTGRI